MPLVDIDGVIIDDDTGEIISAPPKLRHELIAWLQRRHREATEQTKEWTGTKGATGAALMREMGEVGRVENDGLTSSVRGGGTTRTFLRSVWRADLENVELTLADWRDMALNLIDTDTPPAGMERDEFERRYIQRKPRARYVQTDPVKLPARIKKVASDD